MASKHESQGLEKVKALTFLVVAGLVFALGYSIYNQAVSSSEARVLEAGLIEAGNRPTIYFNLRNNGFRLTNYTYRVVGDNAEELDSGLIINVPPGQTFHYTMVLTRPEKGVMTVRLEIYQEGENKTSLIYRQTWLVKAADSTAP